MDTIFTPKNAEKYCSTCDFKCCKNSDWIRHINTKKHVYRHNGNNVEMNFTPYICNCGTTYSTNSGLWKHKKSCKFIESKNDDSIVKNQTTDKDLIMLLIKENSNLIKENNEFKSMVVEQQNMMMEVIKNISKQVLVEKEQEVDAI